MTELQSDPQKKTIIKGRKRYRLSSKILELQDQEEEHKTWRIVVRNDPAIKGRIMEGLHSVLYAGHLGYQKTLKQIQKTFYWPDLTIEVRDYVLDCEVFQKEKSVSRVPAGLLEPLTLPEQKWADVSMNFVIGLPISDEGHDGILIVVDRATKRVHLVPVKQTISASKTARIYWPNIGKLHGISRSVVSDKDPRFVSRFWPELWRLLGSKLRMSSAYHPQTDGQTEAMNSVVKMVLRCILHESQNSSH